MTYRGFETYTIYNLDGTVEIEGWPPTGTQTYSVTGATEELAEAAFRLAVDIYFLEEVLQLNNLYPLIV